MEVAIAENARRGELKKHVGAIHTKGPLTLLQRKIANVLLLNAYEELADPQVLRHDIRLATLANAAGFDSHDYGTLKAALEALVKVTIQWNILDEDGDEEWGVSTFLAQAVIKHGVCRYAYAPDLRVKLYNPEIYANINLAVQERFSSRYGLALYENCVRYRRVRSTGWIEVARWRDLLGVEDGRHQDYKYFRRSVIAPAIREVNEHSDIRVALETQRQGNRVSALRFRIADAESGSTGRGVDAGLKSRLLQAPVGVEDGKRDSETEQGSSELVRRLYSMGLGEGQVLKLMATTDAARIDNGLKYVAGQLARGQAIRNVPAYTLAAIRDGYQAGEEKFGKSGGRSRVKPMPTPASAGTQRAAVRRSTATTHQDAERQLAAARAARIDAIWETLKPEQRNAIDADAKDRLRIELPYIYDNYASAVDDGDALEEMPIVVRSTIRAFRYDLVDQLEADGALERA